MFTCGCAGLRTTAVASRRVFCDGRGRRLARESSSESPGLGEQPVQRLLSATDGHDAVMPSDFQPDGGDWAVRSTQNGWFELQSDRPVEAAQIVYYARTTSPLLECFKDYAVYLNGEPKPAVQGTLEHRRGPQKIALPKQRVTRIRIAVPFVASGRA